MKKNKVFKKNLDLFVKRYPYFIFFKDFVTLPKKNKKKKNFSFLNLKDKEVVYVYGLEINDMYFFLKRWIEKKNRDLIFIEEDKDNFFLFLQEEEAYEIIKNPNIHIYFKYEDEDLFLDKIIRNFPLNKIEILNNSEEKKFLKIKEKILRKVVYHSASFVDSLYSYMNFKNFKENIKKLNKSFFVNSLKDKFKNIPIIICGAGTSLEKNIDLLKKLDNKALIIAGGSAITALSYHNVFPHFGVVIDPNLEEFERMKKSTFFEIPILYTTRVHKDVLTAFNGALGYFKSSAGGIEAKWIEDRLNIKGELIDKKLDREAFSVTTMNLAIAKFLGGNPIILCGVDLSYNEGRRYCSGVVSNNFFSKNKDLKDCGDIIFEKNNVKGKKVKTNLRWIMEADSISSYIKNFKNLNIINVSEGIELRGAENRSLKDIFKIFKEEIDLKGYIHNLINDSYLNLDVKKFFFEIKKSFLRSKKNVFNILKEIKKIIDNKEFERENSSGIILEEFELEREVAYNYFLKEAKDAFIRYLHRYYKPFNEGFKKKDHWNMRYDYWKGIYSIIKKYN
ncbi:MAG: hypothetical protein AMS24_00620 [Chlamydiae bacterium SM23_39]|nr:MAG: hypothetical protein AMS24_00620 [Chlamydiae bacterium SM23_39]